MIKTDNNILVPKWFIFLILLVAFIGLVDATYLTVNHYNFGSTACSFDGCELVTSSEYSTILGLPVALLGAFYYGFVLLLGFLFFDSKKDVFLNIFSITTIVGLLASIVFVGLQLFVIKAICFYCMLSALTSTVLFLLGLSWFLIIKKNILA